MRLRILVDRTSVEMFVDDGRYVHSSAVFPYLVDSGLALFTMDGKAVFRNTVIREFRVRGGFPSSRAPAGKGRQFST